jgi:cytochrome P450
MIASQETTAVIVANTIILLPRHSKVQEELRN